MTGPHASGDATLVVLPTYFEVENIVEVLHRIRAAVPAAQVLVVDDHSEDGTAEAARAVAAELGQIEILGRARKGGLGAAYRAGFSVGLERGFEALVEMDADLSHDPGALPSLLGALDTETDLVIGSRYMPGGSIPSWPWHRRALSRWGNRYAAAMLGLHATDATSGFRAYRAGALQGAGFEVTGASGYAFQIEMTYRIRRWGGRIAEVPIEFVDRVRGKSKMSPWIAGEAMYLVTWWAIRDRVLHLRGRTARRTRAPSTPPDHPPTER